MTTALDIVTGALLHIGVRAAGECVDTEDANEAFILLNQILDQSSNDDFMVVSIQERTANISGKTDWTIGPGGDIDTVRPLRINEAFVRVATIDYPVSVISVQQYEMIGLKQMNGPWPRALYYNSGSPVGTIKFWPNPSSGEIHLFVDEIFTQFATLYAEVQFPPGYVPWLQWTLAEWLMPSYGKKDPMMAQMISKQAARAQAAIKNTNMFPPKIAQFDAILSPGRRNDASFIMHGGF